MLQLAIKKEIIAFAIKLSKSQIERELSKKALNPATNFRFIFLILDSHMQLQLERAVAESFIFSGESIPITSIKANG